MRRTPSARPWVVASPSNLLEPLVALVVRRGIFRRWSIPRELRCRHLVPGPMAAWKSGAAIALVSNSKKGRTAPFWCRGQSGAGANFALCERAGEATSDDRPAEPGTGGSGYS